MRPVKTRIPATELYRENDDVAKVGLGYKRNAFNFFKIPGARKGNPNAVTGIRAVGKQVVALYRADSKVLDPELFICRKNVVLCRCKKGFGMNREGKTIIAVGPADDGAPVVHMRPEKHNIAAVVLDDAGIVDRGYRIRDIVLCENGVVSITCYYRTLSIHSIVSFMTVCTYSGVGSFFFDSKAFGLVVSRTLL